MQFKHGDNLHHYTIGREKTTRDNETGHKLTAHSTYHTAHVTKQNFKESINISEHTVDDTYNNNTSQCTFIGRDKTSKTS